MGRDHMGDYRKSWSPPTYTVSDSGKVLGGYAPPGVNNWGRWGDDDRLGTANLIGPDEVAHAATLARSGKVFSLALPIDATTPRWPTRAAARHYFTMTGSDMIVGSPYNADYPQTIFNDDAIDMPLQGSTQWDGLGHFASGDSFYNGFWAGTVTAFAGSTELSISQLKERLIGRGVLIDMARSIGVESLEPGQPISPEMLDTALQEQDASLRRGDIVLIRTGYLQRWWTLNEVADQMQYLQGSPGLTEACADWFHRHDIAAAASDTIGVEVLPSEPDASRVLPLHQTCLVDLGLTLGEFWQLDDLAADCADDGVYEFMLVAPPLNIPGAVGSPLNPIAIK